MDAMAWSFLDQGTPDPFFTVRQGGVEYGVVIIQRQDGSLRYGIVTEGTLEEVTYNFDRDAGETVVGLVHTHPPGDLAFSTGDIERDRRRLALFPNLNTTYAIVRPFNPDEPFQMIVFELSKKDKQGVTTPVP